MPISFARLGRLEGVGWRHRDVGWAGNMIFATILWQRWAVRAVATVRRAEGFAQFCPVQQCNLWSYKGSAVGGSNGRISRARRAPQPGASFVAADFARVTVFALRRALSCDFVRTD
jgi:hypothetical protein